MNLPPNIQRAMLRQPVFSPYAKPVKPAPAEPVQPQERWQRGEERKLSDALCADLRRRGIPHIVARCDRKSTIREGWPDVTALYGLRACCVELKAAGGKLREKQRECIAELQADGVPVIVAYDLATAIDFIRKTLLLP